MNVIGGAGETKLSWSPTWIAGVELRSSVTVTRISSLLLLSIYTITLALVV